MIRTLTATTRACASAGLGPDGGPDDERDHGDDDDGGDEHGRDPVGEPLDGARERCASATICTIRASIVSRPTLSARMTNDPVWLTVPPMTASPAALGDGHRLAGDHGLVERGPALLDGAVDGHLLARAGPGAGRRPGPGRG